MKTDDLRQARKSPISDTIVAVSQFLDRGSRILPAAAFACAIGGAVVFGQVKNGGTHFILLGTVAWGLPPILLYALTRFSARGNNTALSPGGNAALLVFFGLFAFSIAYAVDGAWTAWITVGVVLPICGVVNWAGTRFAMWLVAIGWGLVLLCAALIVISYPMMISCWECGREGTDGAWWALGTMFFSSIACALLAMMTLPVFIRSVLQQRV